MSGGYRSKGNFSTADETLSWTQTKERALSYRNVERELSGTVPIFHRENVSLGEKIAEGGRATSMK